MNESEFEDQPQAPRRSGVKEIFACLLLSFVFGTVHSFSTWLGALELQFDASRASGSLTYSIALVSLTSAVFLGSRMYSRLSPANLAAACLCLGMAGAGFAALNLGLWAVWLGFGVVFGFANGVGYGFALQFAALVRPRQAGWVMGLVTAAYALGAVATSNLFTLLSAMHGPTGVMLGHFVISAAALPAIFGLLKETGFRFPKQTLAGRVIVSRVLVLKYWAAFGLAVFAGLMLISQASEIMRLARGSSALIASVPALLAVTNLIGAISGGIAVDKLAGKTATVVLSFGTLTAVCLLVLGISPTISLIAVLLVGFFYGATIAAYPPVILRKFGTENSTAIYGKVFTAWGTAGLIAPVIAGVAFDKSGNYLPAIYLAGAAALASAAVARKF